MSRSRRPDDMRRRPPAVGGRPDQGGRQSAAGRPGQSAPGASLSSNSLVGWLGQMSTRNALLAMAAGTLVGIIGTLVAGSEPGFLLAFFITLGAVVGVLGVRRGAVYLFFPLPPFAFFAGAVITGKVHDSSISSTTTGLYTTLLQWIAYIFVPMCIATVLVLLIGGGRWVLGLMLVGGQFPMSDDRSRGPRPRTAPGPRTDVDPWADPARVRPAAAADEPRAANAQSDRRPPRNAPWLGADGARSAAPSRPAGDSRRDRDPWGDPRPSAADPRPGTAPERRPATRNPQPPAPPQPSFQPRPANPAAPGDRGSRPPAPPRPVRPPSDSW